MRSTEERITVSDQSSSSDEESVSQFNKYDSLSLFFINAEDRKAERERVAKIYLLRSSILCVGLIVAGSALTFTAGIIRSRADLQDDACKPTLNLLQDFLNRTLSSALQDEICYLTKHF